MGRTCSKRYWDVHVIRNGFPKYLGFVKAYTEPGARFFALRRFALPRSEFLESTSQLCIVYDEAFTVTPLL